METQKKTQDRRTVLVTGSSRGIGLGIAAKFAAHGDCVALNGRADAERLAAAVDALRKQGARAEGYLADFSDYTAARGVFEAVEACFGPVDVLVNNAGAAHFGLFTDTQPTDWDFIMRNNINSLLNATHLAVPHMVHNKRGVIINISSVWGVSGASCEAVYALSKGAVNAFTKSIAKELGPSGVRVNAVACGAIETRMNTRLSADEKAAFADMIPMGRFGTPDEVGDFVFYLASDAASYLTGQIMPLDGGLL